VLDVHQLFYGELFGTAGLLGEAVRRSGQRQQQHYGGEKPRGTEHGILGIWS
jgi:hypothetical protein